MQRLALFLVVGLLLGAAGAANPEPLEVDLRLKPGQFNTFETCIKTRRRAGTAKVQLYILCDNTGSMGGVIDSAKKEAKTLVRRILNDFPATSFAVGLYRDFLDPKAYIHQSDFMAEGEVESALAAIDKWRADGGDDGSEAQFYALDQIAEGKPSIQWDPTAFKVIAWIGDYPGHDPVCKEISKLPYDITEESLTTKLVDNNITVIAISTQGGDTNGLNGNPKFSSSDYRSRCPTVGGKVGQARRLAAATNGINTRIGKSSEIVDKIVSTVGTVVPDAFLNVEASCDSGIRLRFDPPFPLTGEKAGDTLCTNQTVALFGDLDAGVCTIDYVDGLGGKVGDTQVVTVTSGDGVPPPRPTTKPPKPDECDACSYKKDGRCVSACPKVKSCVVFNDRPFCIRCDCFNKARGGERQPCCELNSELSGCSKAAKIDGRGRMQCTNEDTDYVDRKTLKRLKLQPYFAKDSSEEVCFDMRNFKRNRCSCRIEAQPDGTKKCIFLEKEIADRFRRGEPAGPERPFVPTPTPTPRPKCDACSYLRGKSCVSACPSTASCIVLNERPFCIRCNCFNKKMGGKVQPCCELGPKRMGCARALTDDGPRRAECKATDKDFVTRKGKRMVTPPYFAKDATEDVCFDIRNFKRNRCACRIERRPDGKKRCIFLEKSIADKFRAGIFK